jgi:hypothetical protein
MLIFTKNRKVTQISFENRKIPVVNGIANVPVEARDQLTQYPHWDDYEGQIELPDAFKEYAEGSQGDPMLTDFPDVNEEPKKAAKEPKKPE